MPKRLLVLFTVMCGICLCGASESWYRHTVEGGIEVICRSEHGVDNFSSRKLTGHDDHVILDFMDMAYHPERFSRVSGSGGSLNGSWQGEWYGHRVSGRVSSKVTALSGRKIRWDYCFEPSAEVVLLPSQTLHFGIRVNGSVLDRKVRLVGAGTGTELVLSRELGDVALGKLPAHGGCTSVHLPLHGGELVVSGLPSPSSRPAAVVYKYGRLVASVRLPGQYGNISRFSRSLEIEFKPYESEPLPLGESCNMGLGDEEENDGRGGWTDQGRDNDMRSFPTGDLQFGVAKFRVLDDARTKGRSVMVFGNKSRPKMLKEGVVPVGDRRFDYLYLLHSTAWSKLGNLAGTVTVEYADGSETVLRVEDMVDVANWWSTQNVPRAVCVWSGENRKAVIGMFMSRFKVDGTRDIRRLVFKSGNQSVWCVAGVSGVRGWEIPFSFAVDREVPIEVNDPVKWKVFDYTFNPFYITDGSALDMSFLHEQGPAGRYGKVICRGEKLYFADRPHQEVRFLGCNLTSSACMMEERELKIFPKVIRQLGYNSVRLHHFDNHLVKPGAEFAIDEARLDRFFKTIATLKAHGLYITLDLFTARRHGFGRFHGMSPHCYKILSWYSPEVRENMSRFTRVILGRRNPYTGLRLADDPVLISVGLINENPRIDTHEQHKYPNTEAFWNDLYAPVFDAWCRERGLGKIARPTAAQWAHFQSDQHVASFNYYRNLVRSLGVTVPVSDISCNQSVGLLPIRNHFDYVDMHWYFDHPRVSAGFKAPYTYHDRSSLERLYETPLMAVGSRIFGKPFMMTEWHYCVPNRYRSEGGAATGAYCALNGVSGIFDFNPIGWDYQWKVVPWGTTWRHIGMFNTYGDPINFYNMIMVALLYGRGDVAESQRRFTLVVPPDVYQKDYVALGMSHSKDRWKSQLLGSYLALGAVGKTGVVIAKELPQGTCFTHDGLLSRYREQEPLGELKRLGLVGADGSVVSSTGEIKVWPHRRQLRVVTKRSEALVQEGDRSQSGDCLRVRGNSTFSCVFASSLDEHSLEESRRVLILHTTHALPTSPMGRYRGNLVQHKMGRAPLHVLRGRVQVSLRNVASGERRLFALDMHGNRVSPIPFRLEGDTVHFTADNDLGKYTPFAYELVVSAPGT